MNDDTAHPLAIDLSGLSAEQVAERHADGRVNIVDDSSSRSLGEIARSNILTRFNAIVTSLAVVVLVAGDPRDAPSRWS